MDSRDVEVGTKEKRGEVWRKRVAVFLFFQSAFFFLILGYLLFSLLLGFFSLMFEVFVLSSSFFFGFYSGLFGLRNAAPIVLSGRRWLLPSRV